MHSRQEEEPKEMWLGIGGRLPLGRWGTWRPLKSHGRIWNRRMIQSDCCLSSIILASVLRLKEEPGRSRKGRTVKETSVKNSGRR